jgi:hypothetical protein
MVKLKQTRVGCVEAMSYAHRIVVGTKKRAPHGRLRFWLGNCIKVDWFYSELGLLKTSCRYSHKCFGSIKSKQFLSNLVPLISTKSSVSWSSSVWRLLRCLTFTAIHTGKLFCCSTNRLWSNTVLDKQGYIFLTDHFVMQSLLTVHHFLYQGEHLALFLDIKCIQWTCNAVPV